MPIPRMQDVLENLGGHKCFSTLACPKVLCMKILDIFLLSHPPGDFTSGLGSHLVCQQHPQLFSDLSTNVCQD